MKHTDKFASLTRYPLTIGSPFGDIRLSYEMDTVPCPDCGKFHVAINVLSVPDGISKKQARVFLSLLPNLLGEVVSVVELSALFAPRQSVYGSGSVN